MNNKEFGANSIVIEMPDTQLFYQNAQITFSTALFGIRYLMRNWFFSVAAIAISSMSISLFIFFGISYLVVKEAVKAVLLRLFPNLKGFNKESDDEDNSGDETSGDEKGLRELNSTERIVLFILKALVW